MDIFESFRGVFNILKDREDGSVPHDSCCSLRTSPFGVITHFNLF